MARYTAAKTGTDSSRNWYGPDKLHEENSQVFERHRHLQFRKNLIISLQNLSGTNQFLDGSGQILTAV